MGEPTARIDNERAPFLTVMNVRLFLIAPDNIYSQALESFLLGVGNATGHQIELAGSASDTETAQEQIEETFPDLVLSDLGRPKGAIDGLAVARWAREQRDLRSINSPQVILCSLFEEDVFHDASYAAGAAAFIAKNSLSRELPQLLAHLFPLQPGVS